MIAAPLTITGGRLVLPGGLEEGGVRLENGLIAALGAVTPAEGDVRVDARGALIAPALSLIHI